MIYYGIVGLQIDCSAMVKSGRIKESDMLNRNWAYWTTFCQVRVRPFSIHPFGPIKIKIYSYPEMSVLGCMLVIVHRTRLRVVGAKRQGTDPCAVRRLRVRPRAVALGALPSSRAEEQCGERVCGDV